MLVISRRAEQKVLFPELGVTVQVLRIQGNIVKIGIDAPRDLTIVREEIAADVLGTLSPSEFAAESARQRRHAIRNRLNIATLSLHVLGKKLESGGLADAETMVQKALAELDALNRELEGARHHVGPNAVARRVRALLVEDDSNERELLAGLLRMSGMTVATAADGIEAIEYLDAHERPDVVLLDMRMPRCSGPRTLQDIRANPRHEGLPILAVSGSSPEELGVPIGPGGVAQWVPKPLNPQHLLRVISESIPRQVTA